MLITGRERERVANPAAWHADWLVAFGPDVRHLASSSVRATRRWHSSASEMAVMGVAGSDVRVAEGTQLVVLFSGLLTNAHELMAGATQDDAAGIVLRLLQKHGADAFGRLRGPFAAIAWNRQEGTLLVGRDQVGFEPMFYARSGAGWLLSPSPDVLAAQPGVSSDPDAVALSEWICGWFPAVEDTTYRAVKRVPPGSSITYRGRDMQVRRYWDPFPEGEPIEWLKESDLDDFESRFQQAVDRATCGLAPAIFLSGGLDSIAVAVSASNAARAAGSQSPLALSLVFPDPASTEEPIQTGVASRLGLEQELVPFNDTISGRGLLQDTLSLSAASPQPVWNMWAPAYNPLAEIAAQRGRGVILTGRGGDEWLTVSPYLMADQLMRGNLVGAARLIRSRQQSSGVTGAKAAGQLLWRTAGRPLASAALDLLAPRQWHQRRRRKLLRERASWVAPDPAVRKAMDDRLDRWIDPARPKGGFYQREARTGLRHPAVTHDMEETQEFGRRHGLRVMHPFWDIDLIELLHRVPPSMLIMDGRSKWLLRRTLGQRLPGLGLEKRVKTSAAHVFRGILDREAPPAWERLGGLPTLERIGAVHTAELQSSLQSRSLVERTGGVGRLYTLLNLEAWVQGRA
jgi:asparagine synthase (glutamine-hydrolysing)